MKLPFGAASRCRNSGAPLRSIGSITGVRASSIPSLRTSEMIEPSAKSSAPAISVSAATGIAMVATPLKVSPSPIRRAMMKTFRPVSRSVTIGEITKKAPSRRSRK